MTLNDEFDRHKAIVESEMVRLVKQAQEHNAEIIADMESQIKVAVSGIADAVDMLNSTLSKLTTTTKPDTLNVNVETRANFEEWFLQVIDNTEQIKDWSKLVCEWRPVDGDWKRTRDFNECVGAVNPRWMTCVENGIDGRIVPAANYEYRLTHDGKVMTGTVATRPEPKALATTNNPDPVKSIEKIQAALKSDTTVKVASGVYSFGSVALLLNGLTNVNLVAEVPGTVEFTGFVNGPAAWTDAGKGVYSATVPTAAWQYGVYHDGRLLPAYDSLTALQDTANIAGWAFSGSTMYVKIPEGRPAGRSIKISACNRIMTIDNCTGIFVRGIKFTGCELFENGGLSPSGGPRTIALSGDCTRVVLDNVELTETASVQGFDDLYECTVQNCDMHGDSSLLYFNGVKNSAAGRNYETHSVFAYQDQDCESRSLVIRNNLVRGLGNGIVVYDNATSGNKSFENPNRPLMGYSFYGNKFVDIIDDALEPGGNYIGCTMRFNTTRRCGLTAISLAPLESGALWVTNNTFDVGQITESEYGKWTKLFVKLQAASGAIRNSINFPSVVFAHNTFVMDPPSGQNFRNPVNSGGDAGSGAGYNIQQTIDYRRLKFHDNIFFVRTTGRMFWLALFVDDPNIDGNPSFDAINDIIHTGDVFDFGGSGTEVYSDRGSNPTTIAAYNAAAVSAGAGVRLVRCLAQGANLDEKFLPRIPVAKDIGYHGYNMLNHKGSNVPAIE